MRFPRVLIATVILWLSGIVAHALAQGSFINVSQVLYLSILIFSPLLVALPKTCDGPALAAIVVVAQLLGHIVLGGSDNSSIFMFSTHAVIGVVTYFMISRMDELIQSIGQFVSIIFSFSFSFSLSRLPRSAQIAPVFVGISWKSHLDTRTCARRGPPVTR